ncbi:MAG: LPS export ABC transporter permease LptG [Oligoflexales bacterium]
MILFRYVLKEYTRYVFGTLTLCLFLFILFDFIHKSTGYFSKYEPSSALIAQYYFYQLPFQIMQVLPIGSLMGTIIVMVLLGRSNEITTMRAAGMAPWRVALPLFFGGLVLSALSFILNNFIIPITSKHMHYVQDILIEGQKDKSHLAASQWVKDGRRMIHFQDLDIQHGTLSNISILHLNKNFHVKKAIHAAEAIRNGHSWELIKPKTLTFYEQKLTHAEHHSSMLLKLPILAAQLYIDKSQPDEMSLWELSQQIDRGKKYGGEVVKYAIAWHLKWAYPLASLLVSLMGLPFGYQSERRTETIRSILIAFSVGISYWFILSACKALGIAGDLPAFLAAWSSNIVLTIFLSFQILALRKT